ncbi:GNAT family N-acetyltransferase [Tenacibaculum sp. UWU-22]|uniref:GNAT family N-acetyltransferase n=1 Tax=Tenacibaculum sp. UWU-22 TaxID=3234187 RepID=UPI0034DAFAB3
MKLNFEENIILENKNVRIEPLDLKHIEPLSQIAIKQPDLLKYSPPKFGTYQLLSEYVEKNIDLRKRFLKYPFAIYDKKKMLYAGSTSYLNISQENQRIEIGATWIGREFQKTGLNHNCKFLLIKYVFEKLNFERLEFKTDKRNLQSQRAIERIGGIYEGLLRSHTLMSDGFRRDTVCYSILKSEWKGIKATTFSDIKTAHNNIQP